MLYTKKLYVPFDTSIRILLIKKKKEEKILTPINLVDVQNLTIGRIVNGTQIEAIIFPNCVASSIEEG